MLEIFFEFYKKNKIIRDTKTILESASKEEKYYEPAKVDNFYDNSSNMQSNMQAMVIEIKYQKTGHS